jgi:hypothetical protein
VPVVKCVFQHKAQRRVEWKSFGVDGVETLASAATRLVLKICENSVN